MAINYSDLTLFLIIKNWKLIFFSILFAFAVSFLQPELVNNSALYLSEIVVLYFLGKHLKKLFNFPDGTQTSPLFYCLFYILNISIYILIINLGFTTALSILLIIFKYYLLLLYYPCLVRGDSISTSFQLLTALRFKQIKIFVFAILIPNLLSLLLTPIFFYFFRTNILPEYVLYTMGFSIKILTFLMATSLMLLEVDEGKIQTALDDSFYKTKFPYFRLQNAIFAGIFGTALSLALYLNPKELPKDFKLISATLNCREKETDLQIEYSNPKDDFFSPVSFYLGGKNFDEKLTASLENVKNTDNKLILTYKVNRTKRELTELTSLYLWYGNQKINPIRCDK